MAMVSMYELIMDFPLFKGISRDQVSAMLEKTNIEFRSYGVGECIHRTGEPCKSIGFIVKGNVRHTTYSEEHSISVSQTLSTGSVIGASNIFGWDTTFHSDMIADTSVSILWLTKEDYVRLLSCDDIYLINYLNYLSLHLQQSRYAIRKFDSKGLVGTLALWVMSMTYHKGSNIVIRSNENSLATFAGISVAEVREQLMELRQKGLTTGTNDKITIVSRLDFIEYISGNGEPKEEDLATGQ